MKLSVLLSGIDCLQIPDTDVEITGLCFDSRKVEPGYLFCCLVGTRMDGHDYAEAADAKGAAVLLVQRQLPISLPQVVVEDTRKAFALLCGNWFGRPADRLHLFGVTGTNGKTTTAFMMHTILMHLKLKTGLIGTVCMKSGDVIIGESMTTPEPMELQGLFKTMADDGCQNVVMEVSSHALSQSRVEGLLFETAIFTNLTQDHLDYHGTLEQYAAEKKKLFSHCKVGVFNIDDAHAPMMIQGAPCKCVTFGIENEADYRATEIEYSSKGVSYTLHANGQSARIELGIPGRFTVYNSLGCAAACLAYGLSLDDVASGLHAVKTVPGRIEVVPTGDFPFTVVLDYAHTPDGLDNILSAVRGFAKRRVIVVFGCGGDRDPSKRPLMGHAAGKGANYCIVTSDNPRTEDPQKIIYAILPGVIETGCPYEVVVNRVEAIRRALAIAQPDDVIVLAGKGHEPYQEINGVRYPFDEKEIVTKALVEISQRP